MSDEERDWSVVRQRARARAQRMGLPVTPDPVAPVGPVTLPTTNLFALRGLMVTGRLDEAQSSVVRQMLADAGAKARQEEADRLAAEHNTPYSPPDGAA
ncbi:hypothetical protein AB0F30_33330 [Streptomyces sp. NPDC029006]|uniref:hypothetical protein n=1 Tax=Streptomyces sp. NPDC029006 TaxID=3155467 RepID=UPI0033D34E85